MVGRIYVFPWDQISEGATAIAKQLDCQKILRNGSRYQPQPGDVIVNWGASDIDAKFIRPKFGYHGHDGVTVLNENVIGVLDKLLYFKRVEGNQYSPAAAYGKKGAAKLRFPVLCRTKLKGCDGAGIVIAESEDQLVDAKLYVQLEPKTAEYRVHVGRDRDGKASIMGVQQKFLPRGGDKDMRLRTTANGCYFVWTVDGEPVQLPPQAVEAAFSVFDCFPELTFGGLDVIYDRKSGTAFVVEINTAPEMTPKACELYAEFIQQYRGPKAKRVPEVAAIAVVAAEPEPDVLDVPMGAVDLPPLAENKVEDTPVARAYAEWSATQPEANDPFYAVLMENAFRAAWTKHKEFVYERIYGG